MDLFSLTVRKIISTGMNSVKCKCGHVIEDDFSNTTTVIEHTNKPCPKCGKIYLNNNFADVMKYACILKADAEKEGYIDEIWNDDLETKVQEVLKDK